MRRALMYVVIAALAVAALKHIQVGQKTLWAEAQGLWQSRFFQKGIKSLGDPLLEQLKPEKNRRDEAKKGAKPRQNTRRQDSIRLERFLTDGDGPDDDRSLPPAPIPPPKEPLEA